MGFIIYNADGSIASQQSGASGGGSGNAGKANSPQWVYWTDGSANNGSGAYMPTVYTNMNNPVIRWNGNAYGTMGAGILMKTPGYINNLVGFVNGDTSGNTVQFAAYKNNAIMVAGGVNLETAAQSGSSPFYPSKAGGPAYTFAANDLLSIWIKGSGQINQSFSANLEWVLTA